MLLGKGVELVVPLVHVRRLLYWVIALTLPAAIASVKVRGMPDASDTAAAVNGPLLVPVVVPVASVLPDDVAAMRKVN